MRKGLMLVHVSRRFASALAILAVLGCSDGVGPLATTHYVLVEINGEPVPQNVFRTLALKSDGTYVSMSETHRTGENPGTDTWTELGRYSRSRTTVRLVSPRGGTSELEIQPDGSLEGPPLPPYIGWQVYRYEPAS
jgi:hypothetical protein